MNLSHTRFLSKFYLYVFLQILYKVVIQGLFLFLLPYLLLSETLDPKHKELIAFQKRITKYRDYIFTFLYHPNVPPDNNGSERAIRNVKVKQKISGQFKIFSAAENFAILRSIIDTAIKNNQNVLQALNVIADYKGNWVIHLL